MESASKSHKFADGTEIPSVGLGTSTFQGVTGKQEELEEAVMVAIDSGYRHIDTAWGYDTEDTVGNALEAKIKQGVVKREDIFLVTKLWDRHHDPAVVRKALEDSLRRLKTSYVDMYLIHWPTAFKAMEDCQKSGLAKRIGLSNFNSRQIASILETCTIKPANLQVEVSPYFTNKRLVDFCKEKGIVVTAFAPLGNPARPWRQDGEPNLFEEQLLKKLATEKGKTIAQIILRHTVQRGIVVIPKSITPSRIQENIDIFDFELSEEDMKAIGSLNKDLRFFKQEIRKGHPEYPFNEPF